MLLTCLSYMYADNAVDVLNELGKEQVASYLSTNG